MDSFWFFKTVSLFSSGCPEIPFVDQAGLVLSEYKAYLCLPNAGIKDVHHRCLAIDPSLMGDDW